MSISFENVNIEKILRNLIEIYTEQEKVKITSLNIEKIINIDKT